MSVSFPRDKNDPRDLQGPLDTEEGIVAHISTMNDADAREFLRGHGHGLSQIELVMAKRAALLASKSKKK